MAALIIVDNGYIITIYPLLTGFIIGFHVIKSGVRTL